MGGGGDAVHRLGLKGPRSALFRVLKEEEVRTAKYHKCFGAKSLPIKNMLWIFSNDLACGCALHFHCDERSVVTKYWQNSLFTIEAR